MSGAAQDSNCSSQIQFINIGSTIHILLFKTKVWEGLNVSAIEKKVDFMALHETNIEDLENSLRGNIPGYRLVDGIGHRLYGVLTYVRQAI